MSLVLDSSARLAWIYGDETTVAIRALFDQVADAGASCPTWRNRTDEDFRRAARADLALLDIRADQQTDSHAWSETMHLADPIPHCLYDAAYLELARRRKLPLATLDQELQTAARAAGTSILGTE